MMTSDEWRRVKAVAAAAWAAPEAERALYVERACAGDETLRQQVLALLASMEEAAGLFEAPALAEAATDAEDGPRGRSLAPRSIDTDTIRRRIEQLLATPAGVESSPASINLEGQRLGPYQIGSRIGAGGMGEVYKARDTRLDRTVAIKVLHGHVAADPQTRERLDREARAVAALNHPHICTLHDVGHHHPSILRDPQSNPEQGRGTTGPALDYLVMEYLETLAERLTRGPLPMAQALPLAVQIVSALDRAHRAGIVHRDLKPGNIFLVRSHGASVPPTAKLLDFGLAKAFTPDLAGSAIPVTLPADLTASGLIVGTVQYMAPEQIEGKPTDARTDIFAFGAVLHEMLTGSKAFRGTSQAGLMAAILEHEPASLEALVLSTPPALARVVRRCLAKDPDERWQSAGDLASDLQWITEAGRAATGLSLPVTNEAPRASAVGSLVTRITRHKRTTAVALAILTVAAVAFFFYVTRAPALTEKDTILLTDFTNTTGDAVFDGALKDALAVHLGQSPFLNLFADDRVRETLRLMNRSPDERVTPGIGREICQRQGLKAMLTGSIASLGRNYVIGLEVVNAQTGETLAREQIEAEGKEHVLRRMGEAATRLREKLGESLSSIQKFDVRLEQATTSSLEALKAFSVGREHNYKGEHFEAILSGKHASDLDPNFAFAYFQLAVNYGNILQPGPAREAARKAFDLRERVSEREKLHIAASYYSQVTGDLTKAIEAGELLKQTYPRDDSGRNNLGVGYNRIGEYEKAVEEYREHIRLNPNAGAARANLSNTFTRLNRFDEAKAMGEQAIAQRFANTAIHNILYNVAFIGTDTTGMKQHVDWASARSGDYDHLIWQAGAAAFGGQWQKARDLSNRAADLAEQRNFPEVAGESVSSNAEWAAVSGHCQEGRADLTRAARLPRTPLAFLRAGMSLALCGDTTQAQAMCDDEVKQNPKNTWVNEFYVPVIRAAIEIQRGSHSQAIQLLQAASRYESLTFFYSNYLRGQAYLGERKDAEAASEFQQILNHRGWAPTSPLYPLAHLGLARAALLHGDTAKARKSYQDFFALWKDADADAPVLIAAKKEYEKAR